jgi:hypothetical protein
VAIVHDDYQRVEPGPPYPSVIFHAYALTETHNLIDQILEVFEVSTNFVLLELF